MTVTLEGTVRFALLLASGTVRPPVNAAEVRDTVHDVFPGVFTVAAAQVTPLRVGDATVSVPEDAVDEIALPAALATTRPVTWTVIGEVGFEANWKVAVATGPLAMTLVLIP